MGTVSTSVTQRVGSASRTRRIGRALFSRHESAILIVLITLLIFFYLRNPAILAPITVTSILRTMAFPGLIAMGMVVLMITGEIDLSTASVMSLTAVFAAALIRDLGVPVWLAAVCALGVSLLIGLLNAVLTVRIGVHSVLTTLGVGLAVRGASYLFANGLPIYPLPAEVGYLGTLRPLGVSVAFVLMIIMMVIVHLILSRTKWGGAIFATGANKTAAQVVGINTTRVKTLAFMFTSFLAGCSGLLYMSQLPLPSGDPIIGKNLELDIIAGVILGGVSFFGGRGSAIGTLCGVLLMQVIRTGMVVAQFDPYWQVPVLGVLMLCAASVDVIRHRRSTR